MYANGRRRRTEGEAQRVRRPETSFRIQTNGKRFCWPSSAFLSSWGEGKPDDRRKKNKETASQDRKKQPSREKEEEEEMHGEEEARKKRKEAEAERRKKTSQDLSLVQRKERGVFSPSLQDMLVCLRCGTDREADLR